MASLPSGYVSYAVADITAEEEVAGISGIADVFSTDLPQIILQAEEVIVRGNIASPWSTY